jgi:hypothetical protein
MPKKYKLEKSDNGTPAFYERDKKLEQWIINSNTVQQLRKTISLTMSL